MNLGRVAIATLATAEHDIEEIVSTCPACGGADIAIRGGQDLLLQSIELED